MVFNIAEITNNCIFGTKTKRNTALLESDKYMLADYPVTDYQRDLIKSYRKALRDYFQLPEITNWTFTLENQELPPLPTFPDLTQIPEEPLPQPEVPLQYIEVPVLKNNNLDNNI
jgi:hypothetical protein